MYLGIARDAFVAVVAVAGVMAASGRSIDQASGRAAARHRVGTAQAATVAPGRQDDLAPSLQPLAFLLGDWEAVPGTSGETGASSFRSSIQGHAIVRTNYASYPAAAGKPASRHDDLMVIAPDGASLRADYFDSEGHVIRYVVESPRAGEVVFVSASQPGEPRYRLRYSANPDGTLTGRFDVAPPGKPESFKAFLTWSARRSR
jgi:hypothetical protein